LGSGEKVTAQADQERQPAAQTCRPDQVRTARDLHEKINEVRTRVDEASKPTGPLGIFKLTTST